MSTPTAPADVCAGDCGGNRIVTVDELVQGVNIALDRAAVAQCPAFDADQNRRVTVNELVAAVKAALSGCGRLTGKTSKSDPLSNLAGDHS